MSILIFIIILAILVFVHELGHFLVAKKSGIRVDEFGIGFPPKIFSKEWRGTLYTLNAIPFGGFVKIFGEDSHNENISEDNKSVSFVYKPKWIQATVLVAGVTFNLIFAWIIISLGFMIGLPTPTDYDGLGKVSDVKLTITEVLANSPAQRAGLISGDIIVGVSNDKVSYSLNEISPEKVTSVVSDETTKSVHVEYKRGKEDIKKVDIIPEKNSEGRKIVGIAMDSVGIIRLPIHPALFEGGRTTINLIKETVIGLSKFFLDIFRFNSDFSKVSGPVGIAKVVGEARTLGFIYLLSITAIISINLAVINLLPFPALDGGRLLFVFIEAIIRRPISPKFVNYANTVGFAFLILLMIVVTTNDIIKLF